MKRLILGVVAVAVLVVGFSTATAAPTTFKRTLCHRTASAKHPYVRITVSTRAAFVAKLKLAADIYPVPAGGCPKVALTVTTGGSVLTADLKGANEVPVGDPDGSGNATFRMIRGAGLICYSITAKDIMLPAIAAHIHEGAAGTSGNVVVPLKAPDASGKSSGCAASSRTLVAAMLDNASGYYANVHTTDFPAGAIRGQLSA
jgi:CHRD domain